MRPHSVIGRDCLDELADEARRAPDGDFVEVGVYQGGSLAVLAEVAREQGGRRVWAFDTFTGIPFRIDGVDDHRIGDFSDTSVDMVKEAVPDAHFMVGVFPDTLTDDVGPIALAHIDCDQYQSVYDCCIHLAPRMVPGGAMIFDDPGALRGAEKAVHDAFPPHRIEVSDRTRKWRVRF